MFRKLFSLLSLLLCAAVLTGCASSEQSSRSTALISRRTSSPEIGSSSFPKPELQLPATGGSLYNYEAPAIYADSAIMIDAYTGEVLYQKNADQRRAVASTQKLLTAMILLDSGNLDQQLTVVPSDTRVEPTKLGIRAGERYTRRELLRVLLVKSCNDAASALARDNAGSLSAFAARMNRKAYQLGATSSHFVNPHGLTEPGQFSTARDMARIAFAAYRYPFIRSTVQERFVRFRFNSGRSVTLESTNKLLGRDSSVTGMKTGYTAASGRCLVTSARQGGRSLILVQLGSKTKYIFNDAARLVHWSPSSWQYARRF
jgi:D-alanyl-D-alanine carboxypeptidase (penicillin-binding protein 5/6)